MRESSGKLIKTRLPGQGQGRVQAPADTALPSPARRLSRSRLDRRFAHGARDSLHPILRALKEGGPSRCSGAQAQPQRMPLWVSLQAREGALRKDSHNQGLWFQTRARARPIRGEGESRDFLKMKTSGSGTPSSPPAPRKAQNLPATCPERVLSIGCRPPFMDPGPGYQPAPQFPTTHRGLLPPPHAG